MKAKIIHKLFIGLIFMLQTTAVSAQSMQLPSISFMLDTLDLNEYSFEYDYIPEVEDSIVKKRLESISTEIEMTFNPTVRAFIDYFTIRNRDYTRMVAARTTKYFPIIEEYLKKYDLPDELKYLAIVESGLNPKAKSPAGAVGLWQFMPLTARLDYGLYENWYVDDKMNVEKSTDAACRYLKFLHNYFNGNWQLALAAYNTGPGNIRKAIRRSGYKRSFWEIYPYLYRETRSYVPQFIAIVYALNFMDEHNLFVEDYEYMPSYEEVEVSGFLSFKSIAELTNIDISVIEGLNPEYKREVLQSAGKKALIRIPSSISQVFQDSIQLVLKNSEAYKAKYEYLARNTIGSTYGRQRLRYSVKSGDVLGKIAMRYNVRVADIKKWNNLKSSRIRIGQQLSIWVKDDYFNNYRNTLANKTKVGSKNISSSEYTVQPGDTLWDISRKYEGLTVEKLKKMNNLGGNAIKPGQVLRLKES